MDTTTSSKYNLEEQLSLQIDNNDIVYIERLLREGANPTKIISHGRSSVGYAAWKGSANILIILLNACVENTASSTIYIPKCPQTSYQPTTISPSIMSASQSTDLLSNSMSIELPVENSKQNFENCLQNIPSKQIEIVNTPDGMEALQWDEEIQSSGCANTAGDDDEQSKLYRYYANFIEESCNILQNSIKLRDPHCLDFYGYAPIHYATVLGKLDCLQILLDFGSPINITTNNGLTPLHMAIRCPKIIEFLLKHKADPNAKSFDIEETPLHVAARNGNTIVVNMLLDAGANINAMTNTERSPLLYAIGENHTNAANILINRGANVNAHDAQNITPLYLSVFLQNIQLIERLFENGARLFVDQYLIHYCIHNHKNVMAKLLINYGNDCINIPDKSGYTPLLYAIKFSNHDIIEYLIDNGAKFIDRELQMAIQSAENFTTFQQLVGVLLMNGVDIDTCNEWGETPFVHTVMLEQYQMAGHLLKEGANVNLISIEVIYLIATPNNIHLLKLLVNAGVKINPKIAKKLLLPIRVNTDKYKNIINYIHQVLTNPLTLQAKCRIVIRNSLIAKIKSEQMEFNKLKHSINYKNYDGSILKYFTSHTGLPIALQKYIYDFSDIPPIPPDVFN